MVTRRDFLKLFGAGAGSLLALRMHDMYRAYGLSALGKVEQGALRRYRALMQIAGGTLSPADVPKFVTPLLIPPVMPRAGAINQKGGKPVDYYEISMRQITQQILPAPYGPTTVWGYGAIKSASKRGLLVHNAPSLTIEAKWGTPVRVKWINDLVDANGNYLPHLLPVDPTLHWANPPGGMMERDTRPVFSATPQAYTGPVPIVTHVHGAVEVGDESDGYAEAWYLPAANDVPAGYADRGTWYDFFAAKAAALGYGAWSPGTATFQYPNSQRASTIWYHDHTLGMTRVNVYAGPAGFYIVRGGPAGDKVVLDNRFGTPAVLPSPAPSEGDMFPSNKVYYEIPIAVQDRSFNFDSSLFYPDSRAFFTDVPQGGPFIPDSDISPIWNPEFFGNMMMVNGNTWPFQVVEQRRYRLRFLNGCSSRFLILNFAKISGAEVWQIGNEGGFLAAPVNLTALNGGKLLMGLAERADLIVDFTNAPLGNYVLENLGPDEPFKGFDANGNLTDGESGILAEADPFSTGMVMQFNVVAALAPDPTTPPMYMVLPPLAPLPPVVTTRPLALMEHMSAYFDAPAEAMLGNVDPVAGTAVMKMWAEQISENPAVGDTEVWEFFNFTADAHPMHVHEVVFQVVDRQPFTFLENGMNIENVQLAGVPRLPEAWENGWKDTVIAYPGEVTRIKMRFAKPGQYVWHCHIVEHEDNEMMRPFRIGPEQPGQPVSGM